MRMARGFILILIALVVLGLRVFRDPGARSWRTGELQAPPLPVIESGPAVGLPERVWIDTDAACGNGRATDPDDCFRPPGP